MEDYSLFLNVNVLFMVVFCSVSLVFYRKYQQCMDAFIKSKVLCYMIAFFLKPLYWFITLKLDERASLTIASVVGVVSGITFLGLHMFKYRIRIAYCMLKLETELEK